MERLGDAGLLSKDKLLADGFPTDATAVERDGEHVERLILASPTTAMNCGP